MAEEGSRTRTLTQKGKEYQMELASKDLKRVRSKLTNHLALFETLLRGKDKDLTRTEIEKLDEIAEELKGSVGKYSGLFDGKGEEKIKSEVLQIFDAEMESISRVKEEVTEWLQENIDPNGGEKTGNKLNPTEAEVKDIDKELHIHAFEEFVEMDSDRSDNAFTNTFVGFRFIDVTVSTPACRKLSPQLDALRKWRTLIVFQHVGACRSDDGDFFRHDDYFFDRFLADVCYFSTTSCWCREIDVSTFTTAGFGLCAFIRG